VNSKDSSEKGSVDLSSITKETMMGNRHPSGIVQGITDRSSILHDIIGAETMH
jgi:hypothetical protein